MLPTCIALSAEESNVKSKDQIIEQLTNYSKDLKVESEEEQVSRKRGFARINASPGGSASTSRPSVSLNAITFEFDSSVLTNEAITQLEELAGALASKSLRDKSFELIGHTDAQGSKTYNLDLSNRRAQAVVEYLVQEFDVNGENIKAYGKGEDHLINESNPNASENRRVEVIVK